ncbi:hypothetical protein [Halorussus sp. GCM10023401]|uniref:hypothetical protein n=1 Tax=Halorussus sp. GCM10023401 TaxID=3252680 RepID=UPI00361C97A0
MSDDRERGSNGDDTDLPDADTEAADRPEPDAERREPLDDLAREVRTRRRDDRPKADDAPERTGPLSGLAAEVDERRRRSSGDDSGVFEAVEVGDIDGEELWARLADADGSTVGVGADAPAAESTDDRDVRTVPKTTCHGCPHFAAPPDVACTHEGTEILELVEADRFRVADCPVVVDGADRLDAADPEAPE